MTKRTLIKALVFNGGGARGVGMPGVYYALKHPFSQNASSQDDCCVFDGVETIAGTSVGSLTACLFSIGPSCDELRAYIGDKNLLEVLQMDKATIPFFLSLKPLETFINHYLNTHILKFLEEAPHPLTEDMSLLLHHLKNKDYAITFQDLYHLNQQWPKKFKNLVITSTISENGHAKLVLHDQLNTPSSSIASACIASCAIYPIFKPILINHAFHYDGGCSEPLPSEYFTHSEYKPSERLLFVFGPGPSMLGKIWEKTLFHSASPELKFVSEDEFNLTTPIENELEIYIYIDHENKKVHYRTSNVSSSIRFEELNIPKDDIVSNFEPYTVAFYTQLVKRGEMDSILGNYSIIWLLDYFAWFVQWIYGFKVYIATLFESLCQRLRTFYSFNTVILNSILQGNSFRYAENVKKTVEALYFLQTMNHLYLYEFSDIQESEFHAKIFETFKNIENSFLKAKNLPEKIYSLENQSVLSYYYNIVDEATKNPESHCAFILTLAVQHYLKNIDEQQITEAITLKIEKESSTFLNFFKNRQAVRVSSQLLDLRSTSV